MHNRFLHTILLLVLSSFSEITQAQDCRNIPNPYVKNNLAIQVSNYKIKQNNYEAYQLHNDTELYGRAYEGLISAILDGAHICVIDELIYDFDPGYIDINASNHYGIFPLAAASSRGDINIVSLLLSLPELDVNTTDYVLGSTALMEASYRGHIEVVQMLLSVPNLNINAQNNYDMTALMYAAKYAHINIVGALLNTPDIDVFLEDVHGENVLQIVERLVDTIYIRRSSSIYDYYLNERLLSGYSQIIELLKNI